MTTTDFNMIFADFDKLFPLYSVSKNPETSLSNTNWYTYADRTVAEIAAPGVTKEDVKATVLNRVLTVEVTPSHVVPTGHLYSFTDWKPKSFKHSYTITERGDVDNVEIKVANGVITITTHFTLESQLVRTIEPT